MGQESPIAILYDANGNVIATAPGAAAPTSGLPVMGSDGTNARFLLVDSGGRPILSPAPDVVASGTIAASGVSITTLSLDDLSAIAIQITGTWVGTLQFEATVDGTTWVSINARTVNSGVVGVSTTTNNVFRTARVGYQFIRVRSSAWTSGTATVTIRQAADAAASVLVEALPTGANVIGAVTGSGNFNVVGPGAAGAATSGNPVRIGLSDGTNTRNVLGDASGRTIVVGAAAAGAAVAGNPVLVAGSDGTNAQNLRTASDGTVRVDPTGTTTQPVSAASLPLPTGAATAANQATEISSLGSIDTKTPALVSGRVPVDGSGVTQPVSAASLPLPTGASTSANQTTLGGQTTKINDGANTAAVKAASTAAVATDPALVVSLSPNTNTVRQGAGSGAAATYWYSRITDGTNSMPTMDTAARAGFQKLTDGTNGPAAVKAASAPAVAADPALVVAISPNNTVFTAPGPAADRLVNGTITALNGTVVLNAQGIGNAGVQVTGTWSATLVFEATIDGSNWYAITAYPIGSSSPGILSTTTNGQWHLLASGSAQIRIRASSFTSGTVGVYFDGSYSTTQVRAVESGSRTSTVTSVTASVTNVTLLATNSNRLGAAIENDYTSNGSLFLKLGATASTTSYTVRIRPGAYYEVPFGYTGQIDGIWNVATGAARITELT